MIMSVTEACDPSVSLADKKNTAWSIHMKGRTNENRNIAPLGIDSVNLDKIVNLFKEPKVCNGKLKIKSCFLQCCQD